MSIGICASEWSAGMHGVRSMEDGMRRMIYDVFICCYRYEAMVGVRW